MSAQNKHAGNSEREDNDLDHQLTRVEKELLAIEADIDKLRRRKAFLIKRREKLRDEALVQKSQKLASHNWSRTDHEWSKNVESIRSSVFKLDTFREHQLPTINAILSQKDVILLMPTGGGKSLCYQLPALQFNGLTIVISPLLALMEDQIMALRSLNVAASLLTSNSTKEEVNQIQQDMITKGSALKLLYVTPEKLAKSKRFMSKLQKCYQLNRLSLVAIDEVHCCSQWGHDFRPDYKYLGVLKAMFPDVPVLGVTATATSQVLVDVQKMLNIQGCLVIKAHFNRPNLYYEVREKSSVHKECVDQLDTLLKQRFAGKSGIIYTTTIKDCEDLRKDLKKLGNSVGCYHAQLSATERSNVHTEWLNGECQAVIATVAFGLGIDKPDVRFVIHHCLSKSMENYYQESGRAGRDSQPADCIMFYRLADIFRISTMVYAQRVALEKLYTMVAYCTDKLRCRREMIASQFEEQWESRDCNEMCDHCRKPKERKETDITSHCLGIYDILTKAANIEKRLTGQMVIDAWMDKGPVELRVTSGSKPPLLMAEATLAHLLVEGYLEEDIQITPYKTNTYIRRGPRAASVLSGKHNISMTIGGHRKQPSSSQVKQRQNSTPSSSSLADEVVQMTEASTTQLTKKHLSSTLTSTDKSKDLKSTKQLVCVETNKSHKKCEKSSTVVEKNRRSSSPSPGSEGKVPRGKSNDLSKKRKLSLTKTTKKVSQSNSKPSASSSTFVDLSSDDDDFVLKKVLKKSMEEY